MVFSAARATEVIGQADQQREYYPKGPTYLNRVYNPTPCLSPEKKAIIKFKYWPWADSAPCATLGVTVRTSTRRQDRLLRVVSCETAKLNLSRKPESPSLEAEMQEPKGWLQRNPEPANEDVFRRSGCEMSRCDLLTRRRWMVDGLATTPTFIRFICSRPDPQSLLSPQSPGW